MTFKQKLFIKEYVKSKGNGVQTALKVYNPANYFTANAISSENLKKPIIQRGIMEELEANGITDNYLIIEHKKIIKQDKDLSNKTKSIELAYKLKGHLKESLQGGVIYNTQINIKDNKAVEQRIKELEAELDTHKSPH